MSATLNHKEQRLHQLSIIFTNSDIVSKKPAFSRSVSVLVNSCYSYLKEHRFHSTVFHLNQFRHIRCWDTQAVSSGQFLLFCLVYHTVILMTLSLLTIKDSKEFINKRSSFLIFTPKNSQFLKPQNLLLLLSISINFSSEIKATM